MKDFVVIITFIPWILFFCNVTINSFKDLKYNDIDFVWIKENLLKVFHFDNLMLFGLFIFFSRFYNDADQLWLTKVLLFSVINLYLYFNRYYDKNNRKEKLVKDDISTLAIVSSFVIFPVLFYLITGMYTITYYIMFAFGFLNYLIVYCSMLLNRLFFSNKYEK